MHDDGSLPHLIEVKSDANSGMLPVRGLSCSSGAMPFLKSKFPTYHDFASSTLSEIYDTKQLSKALRLEANQLASGLLINDGSGIFQWRALATLAQNSPGYSGAIVDLNGDGHQDIYFVQNHATREPETGAWSGGLSWLLRGDGDGNFHPVWPDRSGIAVPGDAKGMGVGDANGDGWPDIVVARNNDTMIYLQNKPAPGQQMMRVRLIGPAGNPTGVGARVQLSGSAHPTQTVEVHAGSGYLSQSTSDVFFGTAHPEVPARIEVIWPDGSQLEQQVEWTSELLLRHPAQEN